MEERINRVPQGAPHSETLHKILKMLISEKDAELVAKLPIKQAMASKQMKSVYLEKFISKLYSSERQ